MKLIEKSIKKVALRMGVMLLLINHGLPAFLAPIALSTYTPTVKTRKNIVSKYEQKVPKNFNSLDYVNLSNMLINNEGEGYGVCRDYAVETLTIYNQLIEENGRGDLEGKIRLVCGTYGYTYKNKGHMWVEVYKDDKWLRYESTDPTPNMSLEDIPEYSEKNLKQKQDLNGEDELIVEMMKTFKGTQVFYPWIGLFLNGGIAEIIYYSIKDP